MSFRNVSCLACNSTVGINSSKNIFKTAFVETGEIIAPFISTTLMLSTENLRSSHLCLHCLNLFGKLEQVERKAKKIRREIVKKFISSCKDNRPRHVTVHNVVQDTPAKSEVSFVKPRAVITPCMQKKIVNIPTKKPNTHNSMVLNNVDTAKPCVMQIKNEQSLDDIDTLSQSDAKETVNLEVSHLPPSLWDHQYTQLLSTESQIDTSPKIVVVQQQREIVKNKSKVSDKKDKNLSTLENSTSPNCGMEEGALKDQKLNSKVYICEKCGKFYRSQKTLKLHLRTHDGTSPFSCTVCKKHYTTSSLLKKHMSIHTENGDLECNICSKKFIHRTNFMKHTLLHNQPKICKCHICGLIFSRRAHLNRHLRIHAGDKRFSCGVCGKLFFERYNVLSHLKTHDPERKQLKEIKLRQKRVINRRCERCDIDFASAGEYIVHLHTHTPQNMILYEENNFMNDE